MTGSVRTREVRKGESHSHPYHVDIQVGSCICLNAIMLNHCMLLTGSEYVHMFITQLPKDYYLILGKLHHKTC